VKDKKKTTVTVHDIAQAIDISASTVSRALNNHPKISQKTKEKVWSAAKQLGYQPNIPAYMNRDSSKTICFMVPEINNAFYLDTIERVQEYVLKKGYNFYLAYTNNSLDIEKTYVQSIINLNVEGVIVALFDKSADISHLNSFLAHKIPTVFINKTDQIVSATQIILDIAHGTYKATKHLLSMGCKNIHLFTGNRQNPLYSDMVDGFRSAISDAGGEYSDHQVFSESLAQRIVNDHLSELLNQSKLPDGIITPNTQMGTQIISWLNNNKLQVPQDVLLVSFESNNNNLCSMAAISAVQFSGSKTGKTAAKRLFEQIEKKRIKKETIIIPGKFIIKGSSMRF